MTTTMNCLSEAPVRPRVSSFSLRWRPCTAADKKALCESGGFTQTQVWGKHSAWLSAPRVAAALGVGSAGRSPHPLPTGGSPEP